MTVTLYTTILFVFLGLFLVALLLSNYEVKQQRLLRIRAMLRDRVYKLRLSKMLEFLGVDIDKYIKIVPQQDIAKHIRNCTACPEIPTCDACLRDGKPVNSMYFCPNFKSLTKHSKTLYENR